MLLQLAPGLRKESGIELRSKSGIRKTRSRRTKMTNEQLNGHGQRLTIGPTVESLTPGVSILTVIPHRPILFNAFQCLL
jgi:hypothetical protein